MLGWALESATLVSFVPASFALQFNTAFCLVLCGVGVAAAVLRRGALAAGASSIVLGIAGLSGLEIVLDRDIGIGRMLFDASGSSLVQAPLAPNTVLALVLAAISVILLVAKGRAGAGRAIAAVIGAGIAAVGMTSSSGYAMGLSSAYRWGERTPMSLPASLGAVAIGAAVLAGAWAVECRRGERFPRWVAVAALAGFSAVSVLLLQALELAPEVTAGWDPAVKRSLHINSLLTAVFGIAASLALAAALELARRIYGRSRELQQVNATLDKEVEQRRIAQESAERLNKTLNTVSACRQAIAHSKSEQDLLDSICEIAVNSGGYRLVWIGIARDDEGKSVQPMAQCGTGKGYIEEGMVSWADEPRGRGPTGTAIRTCKPVLCRDTRNDELFEPWRERAEKFGFRSSLVVPLAREEVAFGSVSIYAATPDAFGEDEVIQFSQLATDVSFGIEMLRARAERERAEAALQASEERYRCLALATAQIVWMTDQDGLVHGDIPSWRAFTGKTRDQIKDWGWLDSLHPEDRERTARAWSEAVGRAAPYEIEYRIRRSDGEYRDMWVRGVPVLERDGQVREWVGTCTDVTDRQRAEQQLRAASRYARNLLEASLDALVTISPEGIITDVNQATEAATGRPRENLIGTDFCAYFTEPDKARQGYQQVFAAGFVRDFPLVLRHASGGTCDVLYHASVYRNEAGETAGVFATARDITERKRAEERLARYAQELERSNSELQEFAFVASHDLQEPLRKITAFSDRLRDRCAGQLDDVSLDFLNRMRGAALRMARLIDSLLDYSRLATRAMPFEEVDLASTCVGVIADLEQRIRDTGARVTVQTLPRVLGDPIQLRQLLQNLLANALKFHAPGARPGIVVSAVRNAERWEVSVSDDGIGFDPAYADRIFRPFQRLHARNEYEGSGMGLAICRKIAQRHGTAISVQSQPGKGATFTVSLPAVQERTEPCQNGTQCESFSPKTMTTISC
jgi:PAS domain S-box-containing protein